VANVAPTNNPASIIVRLYHQRTDGVYPRILLDSATFGNISGLPANTQVTLDAKLRILQPGSTCSYKLSGLVYVPDRLSLHLASLTTKTNFNSNGTGDLIITLPCFDTISGILWEQRTASLCRTIPGTI
jgi:hypothetical protein